MLEEILFQLLVLSVFANIVFAIISFTLIIIVTIIICKKNHISAEP